METDGSFLFLKDPATCPYPESNSSSHVVPTDLRSILIRHIIQPTPMFPLITRPVIKDMYINVVTCFKLSSDRIIEGSVGK